MSLDCTNESSCSSESDVSSFINNEAAANFSKLLLHDLDFVKESFEAVQHKVSEVIVQVNEARGKFEALMLLPGGTKERDFKVHQLKKEVSKLKSSIPFNLITPSQQPNPNIRWCRPPQSDPYQVRDRNLDTDEDGSYNYYYNDDDSPAFTYDELKSVVQRLYSSEVRCLSCFLFFPENVFIKRSILFCWADVVVMTGSYFINKAMDELIKNGLIQVVYKKSNLAVAGYRMHPFVHSTLKSNQSWSEFWSRIKIYLSHSLDVEDDDIYYSTESFEQILQIKHIEVLYLGKWQKPTDQHIEVTDTKLFLKELYKLRGLKFVSLRGISMIEILPEFITQLEWLEILDLKACYNLEIIPSSIANLQHSLIHLDMSECYLMDQMPKALATLVKLKVLKGFLVNEHDERSCTLEDLENLQQLEKLNIYTSVKGFPNKSQFATLQKFGNLRSLTISWGGCTILNGSSKSIQEDKYDESKPEMTEEHPSSREGARLRNLLALKEPTAGDHETLSFGIEKLDLQCVPETVTSQWLKPVNFGCLKKLYIRGGHFFDLDMLSEESKWEVEILRLKHLSKLKNDWRELEQLFPKLICLEKVNCPNLSQFPCDESGIWMKK